MENKINVDVFVKDLLNQIAVLSKERAYFVALADYYKKKYEEQKEGTE